MKTETLADDSRNDMLTGVLLHQVQPPGIVDAAGDTAVHLQSPIAQMDHLMPPLENIQHPGFS